MSEQPYGGQTLFGPSASRKYLNAAERQRFLESAQQLPRLFCLTLGWSGARFSEVLALIPASIDIESGMGPGMPFYTVIYGAEGKHKVVPKPRSPKLPRKIFR